MGILFCKNNITEMYTIQTYTLLETEPQISKNSLAHRSWDSGHSFANVVLELVVRLLAYTRLLRYPQGKKSSGVRCGLRGGHGMSPRRDINFPVNISFTTAKDSLNV